MNNSLSTETFKNLLIKKLSHNFGVTPKEATYLHIYNAMVLVIKDMLLEKRKEFTDIASENKQKQVYYLCMEFLMGRSLKNALFNLGIESTAKQALSELSIDINDIYSKEIDAGLGNGGLGRLAACFLDSLATQGYSAIGYSLKYEYGIFKQKLVDGWQTELPDFWLSTGEIWLQPHPERAVKVLFNGEVRETWTENHHSIEYVNPTTVLAIPYDLLVPGLNGKGVSKLRLWASKSNEFDMSIFNSGDYMRAMERDAMAKVITRVLYPEDNHPEGKSLRITQQYFLVSATIQDIIFRHLRNYESIDSLPDKVAIHLNDTHPVLAIPEMMRVLMDICGYNWDDAWNIVNRTVAYTNHTVMKEALECWNQELIRTKLPRIYQILEEINRRFCQDMHNKNVDGYQVGRMAIINDGFVKMANLAVAASHCVNGVSALHSDIIKNTVFKDFYPVMPEKFKNVTNGIAHRRWLCQANEELSDLIKELIGDSFITDAARLKELEAFKDDKNVLARLEKIKFNNKERLAKYIKENLNININPESIFDVQAKRLHEYKRQLLNVLNIISEYQMLRNNPTAEFTPKTYIFAAKAAPGYYFAKKIIQLIYELSTVINNDKSIKDKIKIVFLEDYSVSLGEILIPAAEISQQISLAGTEASGTGNMKFMINGAVTLGTMDGANVEIFDVVGKNNIVIFGLTAEEVEKIKKDGYNPLVYYNNNCMLKNIVDEINRGFGNTNFTDISHSLTNIDPFMVMADFSDYNKAHEKITDMYKDKENWNKMSLINIANSGVFSADRAIRDYAENIWGIKPIN